MREYEFVYIVQPDVEPDRLEEIHARVVSAIEGGQGRVLLRDDWGKRKLAYEIQKFQKGHYFLVEMLGDGKFVAELERNLRLDPDVLRYLTILVDPQVKDVAARVERAEKEDAERAERRAERERLDRERQERERAEAEARAAAAPAVKPVVAPEEAPAAAAAPVSEEAPAAVSEEAPAAAATPVSDEAPAAAATPVSDEAPPESTESSADAEAPTVPEAGSAAPDEEKE